MDVVIGRRVHHLMWERRLSQTAFAPQIGMTQNTLTRKLRGERGWSADEIAAAAQVLEVEVGYLFKQGPVDYKAVVRAGRPRIKRSLTRPPARVDERRPTVTNH